MITYAIGDVHGRDDLLEQMHGRIAADRRDRYRDARATIVHVGDYVDRGPDSLAVIDRLRKGVTGFETVCLKGNHEAMMLDCAVSDDRQLWSNWRANGGDATLRSLGLAGLSGGCDSGRLTQALGAARLAWLRSLPLTHHNAAALFVHAGIVPGRPMELQAEHDLLWIRDGFLGSDDDHGFLVVHGHTPMAEPDVQPNRLGIDTGAVYTGRLTAAVLSETERLRFLVATA
ncbi:MAG: serine/threonine protein phosphatase [Alphaproteobacteria bacterium]|nr:serine/threonine protein phosphatase [Alphaproteobacteria bacterium]